MFCLLELANIIMREEIAWQQKSKPSKSRRAIEKPNSSVGWLITIGDAIT